MRRASLLTLFLIVFIDLVGFGIMLPNQQLYGKLFGISNTYALVMIGPAYSLFQFLFAPLLGKWSDRVGRKPVLIISQMGTIAGFLLLYFSHFLASPTGTGFYGSLAIGLLYVSRIIDGISGGNISIVNACVADITTPQNRAKGMGIIGAAFGLGFVLGPVIGAFTSKFLGLQAVPLVAVTFSVTALCMTIFTLPETRIPIPDDARQHATDVRRFSILGLRHSLARPIIGNLILMAFANGFAFAGMEQTFSLLLQLRMGGTPDEASWHSGLLFGIIGIIIVIIQGGLIRPLTKRFGEAKLVAAGPLLIAPGLVLVGIAGLWIPTWTGFIAGSMLMAIGSSLFQPSNSSLVSRHAGEREQGEILGALQGMQSLARGVGPILAGALYTYFNPIAPYFTSAAICMAVGLVALAYQRSFQPPAVSPDPAQPAAYQAPVPSAE